VSPQGSDLVLASDIPHGEADVLIFHCFHVETCREKGRKGVRTRMMRVERVKIGGRESFEPLLAVKLWL
jgi:hypothetical protein